MESLSNGGEEHSTGNATVNDNIQPQSLPPPPPLQPVSPASRHTPDLGALADGSAPAGSKVGPVADPGAKDIRMESGEEEEDELMRKSDMLLVPPAPQERVNKSSARKDRTRSGSIGISYLVSSLNLERRNSTGTDSVFGSGYLPGDPNMPKKTHIQSGPSHNATATGTGTGDGTGSGSKNTGSTGGDNGKKCDHGYSFPPAYSNVRKARAKSVPYTELNRVEGNRRKQATSIRPGPGFDIAEDDRQFGVSNFHIPLLKKNVSSSLKRTEGELYCVTCEHQHDFSGQEPFCVILTDQNFPPSLPSSEKCCVVVIRLEDCLLNELPGVLKEFFGNRSGYLLERSLLMFGSMSHLLIRGLESYAEEVVKIFKVFSNMLARGCSLSHSVFVPVGGVEGEGIMRDIYDLDCWLRNGAVSSCLSLPNTRANFWKVVRDENGSLSSISERVLFLPELYSNSRKIRTISGSAEKVILVKIKKTVHIRQKTNN
jgi:hypothetical protein